MLHFSAGPLEIEEVRFGTLWAMVCCVKSSVLARPLLEGTVPFGLLMCPLWSGLEAKCALASPLPFDYFTLLKRTVVKRSQRPVKPAWLLF